MVQFHTFYFQIWVSSSFPEKIGGIPIPTPIYGIAWSVLYSTFTQLHLWNILKPTLSNNRIETELLSAMYV